MVVLVLGYALQAESLSSKLRSGIFNKKSLMQLQKLFNSNVVVVQSREGGTDAVSLMSTNDMILSQE